MLTVYAWNLIFQCTRMNVMSERSSARGQQRTIIMFDIVPPGLRIKSTFLISAHKERWQPVHHLSPFAFQWKRWVMGIWAEFCLMSFFPPVKRFKGFERSVTHTSLLSDTKEESGCYLYLVNRQAFKSAWFNLLAFKMLYHRTPNFTSLNSCLLWRCV